MRNSEKSDTITVFPASVHQCTAKKGGSTSLTAGGGPGRRAEGGSTSLTAGGGRQRIMDATHQDMHCGLP